MEFTFSKEIIPFTRVEGFGVLEKGRMYKVFLGANTIGQYFGHHSVSFFACGDLDVRITHDGYAKKVPRTSFFGRPTATEIGKYQRREDELPKRGRTFAKLWLGEKVYEGFEVNVEKKGLHQVQVGREFESVAFFWDFDRARAGIRYVDRPITRGTGYMTGENLSLLFGGLCLLEEFSELVSYHISIGD